MPESFAHNCLRGRPCQRQCRRGRRGAYAIVPGAALRCACDPDNVPNGPQITRCNRHVCALLTLLAVACCALSTRVRRDGRYASTRSTSTASRCPRCRMPCARRWCAPPAGARPPMIRRSPHGRRCARYVKSYTTGPRGESQVVFDAAAVERAITAAGRSLWERERPFTLVVLDPPRTRAAADAARAELERVAAERGLPISLIPLAARRCRRQPAGRRGAAAGGAALRRRRDAGRPRSGAPMARCSGRCTRRC